MYVSVNAVRSLAVLLEPFIPFSCEKIWAQLKLGSGGSVHQQGWESAKDIKAIPAGHELGKVEPIFRKIEAKEIEQWKNKLGKPQ
jgi:methionyl-tRNA synthetase